MTVVLLDTDMNEEHKLQNIHVDETDQYLTFILENEIFSVPISRVKEVLEVPNLTKVPHTPEFMSGVINLRGQVVPIVDLKLQFNMGKISHCVDTCIIILEVNLRGEYSIVGALADSVQEVIEIEPKHMLSTPDMGLRIDPNFVTAMGKLNDEFVIILNIDNVFSEQEISLIQRPSRYIDDSYEN